MRLTICLIRIKESHSAAKNCSHGWRRSPSAPFPFNRCMNFLNENPIPSSFNFTALYTTMDTVEATKMVMPRIQKLDPENASKIMGYILIQDQGENEMIRLAFGPEF